MSKPFHFKQFSIEQDLCAMKVSLDACLFGAVCEVATAKRILDIGTGSGLLSLMLAQRCNAQIDAVEIDADAYKQAILNFQNSPFNQRIKAHQSSIQNFVNAQKPHQYDTIICNPPFFTHQLASQNPKRHLARHNDALSFEDLAQSITHCLHPAGKTWLLLPPQEQQNFDKQANAHSLYLQTHFKILARENTPSKLGIFVYSKSPSKLIEEQTISVYQADSTEYTQEFKGLLRDYYLKL